jgi:hypothetical protein
LYQVTAQQSFLFSCKQQHLLLHTLNTLDKNQ